MELFETILAFMDKGGNVLWIIATLVFFMWTLIIERFIYFLGGGWKADRLAAVNSWGPRRAKVMERKADPRKALVGKQSVYQRQHEPHRNLCCSLSSTWAVGDRDGYDRGV